MSSDLMIVVRCAKAPAKNYHFIFKTPAVQGSTFFERLTNLEWIAEIDQPIRIDISSNWLTEVDLRPLESCTELEYLSLAVNKLDSIDLTPLQNCTHLRHLDISHNQLTEVDLTPLAGCKELVYLYLQENMFNEVNIAPLFQLKHLTTAVIQLTSRGPRPRIIIDSFMSNVPPNLNDALFSFLTGGRAGMDPEWLYVKDTDIKYSPKSYRKLVSEFGWSDVKKHLVALSKQLRLESEFAAQKLLLDDFGMPELACYDGRVRDIVKLLPTKGSYRKGVQRLYSQMVTLLEAQLERCGSTLYFDLDLLSTTPGSVLLPAVLKRREAEMQELILYDYSGRIDLFPLWLTSYGYQILSALGLKRFVHTSQLPEINKALKKINHKISFEKVVQDDRKDRSDHLPIGGAIKSYVRQTVSA